MQLDKCVLEFYPVSIKMLPAKEPGKRHFRVWFSCLYCGWVHESSKFRYTAGKALRLGTSSGPYRAQCGKGQYFLDLSQLTL